MLKENFTNDGEHVPIAQEIIDLLNGMILLRVEKVEECLRKYHYDADFMDPNWRSELSCMPFGHPIKAIPMAWTWMLDGYEDDDGWVVKNNRIKCLLSEYLGIDWENIESVDMPDYITKNSYELDDFYCYNNELFNAAFLLDYSKVKTLLDNGMILGDQLEDDEQLLPWIEAIPARQEMEMEEYMQTDEVKEPDKFYESVSLSLVRGGAYNKMYCLLEKYDN